jgi:hypothetical protein
MKKFGVYFLFTVVLLSSILGNLNAQDLLKNRDLKTFRTELLTDADVLKIHEFSESKIIDRQDPKIKLLQLDAIVLF